MSRRWVRAIAVLEIVGGVSGVPAVLIEILNQKPQSAILVMGFALIAIFLLSLFAGIQLWRNKRSGYTTSIMVQLIQFPKIVTGSLAFMIELRVDVWVMASKPRDRPVTGLPSLARSRTPLVPSGMANWHRPGSASASSRVSPRYC